MGWLIQGSDAGRGRDISSKQSVINPSNTTTFIFTEA
jgi:hypothetical protein